MQIKIHQLQQVNQYQHDKIKKLAYEKQETLAHVDTIHHRMQNLNYRLTSKNHLYKQGKEKNSQQIAQLEKRIKKLSQQLNIEYSKPQAAKELPYQRHQRLRKKSMSARSKSKKRVRSTSRNTIRRSQRGVEANSYEQVNRVKLQDDLIKIEDGQEVEVPRNQSVEATFQSKTPNDSKLVSTRSIQRNQSATSQSKYPPAPPRHIDSHQVTLKKSQASPNNSLVASGKYNKIPFVPLRNPSGKILPVGKTVTPFIEKRDTTKNSVQSQQDSAKPATGLDGPIIFTKIDSIQSSIFEGEGKNFENQQIQSQASGISSKRVRDSPSLHQTTNRSKSKKRTVEHKSLNQIKQRVDSSKSRTTSTSKPQPLLQNANKIQVGGRQITQHSSKSQVTFGDNKPDNNLAKRTTDQSHLPTQNKKLVQPDKAKAQSSQPEQTTPYQDEKELPRKITVTVKSTEAGNNDRRAEMSRVYGDQHQQHELGQNEPLSGGTLKAFCDDDRPVGTGGGSEAREVLTEVIVQQSPLTDSINGRPEVEWKQKQINQDDLPLKYSESNMKTLAQKGLNDSVRDNMQIRVGSASSLKPSSLKDWPSGSLRTMSKEKNARNVIDKINPNSVSPLRNTLSNQSKSVSRSPQRNQDSFQHQPDELHQDNQQYQHDHVSFKNNESQSEQNHQPSDEWERKLIEQQRKVDEIALNQPPHVIKEEPEDDQSSNKSQLTNLVLELAKQVKGLKDVLDSEIDAKKQKDSQMHHMQDQYFKTLDELRIDLGCFKQRVEQENKVMKDELQNYRKIVELQNMSYNQNNQSLGSINNGPFTNQGVYPNGIYQQDRSSALSGSRNDTIGGDQAVRNHSFGISDHEQRISSLHARNKSGANVMLPRAIVPADPVTISSGLAGIGSESLQRDPTDFYLRPGDRTYMGDYQPRASTNPTRIGQIAQNNMDTLERVSHSNNEGNRRMPSEMIVKNAAKFMPGQKQEYLNRSSDIHHSGFKGDVHAPIRSSVNQTDHRLAQSSNSALSSAAANFRNQMAELNGEYQRNLSDNQKGGSRSNENWKDWQVTGIQPYRQGEGR